MGFAFGTRGAPRDSCRPRPPALSRVRCPLLPFPSLPATARRASRMLSMLKPGNPPVSARLLRANLSSPLCTPEKLASTVARQSVLSSLHPRKVGIDSA